MFCQNYMREFRYNHIGETPGSLAVSPHLHMLLVLSKGREYWSIDKNKSLGRTLDCAKLVLKLVTLLAPSDLLLCR